MAIPLEFANVIVRKSAVERSFPGGLDGFARQNLSNLTEDEHLLRVNFMSTHEAWGFATELEATGLHFLEAEADSDIACFACHLGGNRIPSWLSVGTVDGHSACWASAYPVGELAWPEIGFMLHCPRRVYHSLTEVVRQCQTEVQEMEAEAGCLAKLRCTRGDAEILIDVVGDREGDTPIGLMGWRQLARRSRFRADVALIHDLESVLVRTSGEDKSCPRSG